MDSWYTPLYSMSASAPPSLPPIIRFLLPSVRDIFFLLLFFSILLGPLSNRPLLDADIGWHIRSGELILQAHSVPRTDPFAAVMQGSPSSSRWFAWEWLYDVVLGFLHHAAGLNGIVWLCALLVALTFAVLLRLLLQNGTGLPLALVLTLLALGAATIHLYARPHIASWLLSLLWFAALDFCERASVPRWLPWIFPFSMLLWVNLHGGWVLGMALLGAFALAAAIECLRMNDGLAAISAAKRTRALCAVFGWSALATLVNPYGWRLHAHIYAYLNNRYLMNRINEFRSPDFHGWAERCFAAIVIFLVVGLAGRRRDVKLSHLLVALLAVYAGFYSSRNLPVSAMLLALIAGPILWGAFASLPERAGAWDPVRNLAGRITTFSGRMMAQEWQLRGHLWPVVAVSACAAICLQGGWLGSHHWIHAQFDETRLPAAAVAFLDQQDKSGPVFSTDAWGGYLIYHWYPARRVLIDDRHDFYGTDRIRDYLVMMQGETGWQDVLEKWQIQTALLPAGATLANLLRELPGDWHVVYEDKVAVIFEKKSAPRGVP